ncbi:hypothetical protein J3R30DRAFT_3715020 [Lentinula aciculospora]|uniref:Uncharacterized protein n=1 Tax=Lentinula aciculospora TaxID=153920 RepID=A0A9W8ZXQ9_9AGAR|nr:hypothetical protein J3R30DRAFT_3715020 [Lentinula aciculospora]
MLFGLCLRFVLASSSIAQGRLYPAILGVWEGVCLRYLINLTNETNQTRQTNQTNREHQHNETISVDPFLSYGVRLCIDYFITDSFTQVFGIVLWSFLGALMIEGVETGSMVDTAGHTSPNWSKRSTSHNTNHRTGTSFTKIQVHDVPPTFYTPSTASPVVGTASTSVFSPRDYSVDSVDSRGDSVGNSVNGSMYTPVDVSYTDTPLLEVPVTSVSSPPIPNIPSESIDARSSELHGSYTLPPPTLFQYQSPAQHSILNSIPNSIPNTSVQSPLPIPILAMSREEFEYYPMDELQTPLPRSHIAIPDEDNDENNEDELQTPLALPISSIGFDNPPELELEPSMLLRPPLPRSSSGTPLPIRPIRSTNSSPVPVPAPGPQIQSESVDLALLSSPHLSSSSPLSTLRPLTAASSPSSSSPPDSVISAISPTTLYTRADSLRKQAWKEERFLKTQLEHDLIVARIQGRTKDVFLLVGEIKGTQARIDRLHMRAKRRYYQARNSRNPSSSALQTQPPFQIDVHGLLVLEAIEQTEEAFRDVLRNGHRFLRVIVAALTHLIVNDTVATISSVPNVITSDTVATRAAPDSA